MSAFVIGEIKVHDARLYDEYRRQVQATLDAYDGRFVVRGGDVELLEGDWNPPRLVILEFPDMARARAWWSSAEYTEPKAMRQRAAVSQLILVDGAG